MKNITDFLNVIKTLEIEEINPEDKMRNGYLDKLETTVFEDSQKDISITTDKAIYDAAISVGFSAVWANFIVRLAETDSLFIESSFKRDISTTATRIIDAILQYPIISNTGSRVYVGSQVFYDYCLKRYG